MYVKSNRTFVYGHFTWPGKKHGGAEGPEASERLAGPGLEPVPPGREDIAIEILREYSANEFVGKLYRRAFSGDWTPMEPSSVASYEWYDESPKARALTFEMEGSGSWEVLHFRTESDDTGPYIAVALKYAAQRASR